MMKNKMKPYIFIKIPRTASYSINKVFPQSGNHLSVMELREEIKAVDWDNSFKFTFTRHPYTRFLSAYEALELDKNLEPNEHLDVFGIESLLLEYPTYFKSQYSFIVQKNGEVHLDAVFNFENLEENFETLKRKLDADPKTKLPKTHQTEGGFVLTPKSKRILNNYYQKDFTFFDYDFGI